MKGAGDLATGAALALHRAGFDVVMTEQPEPTAVRLAVSFAAAVFDGACVVEGVRAERAAIDGWRTVVDSGAVAVLVDPAARVVEPLAPLVVVDAIMAKRNTGTTRGAQRIVVALGPGFVAGADADAVVETVRGPEMGRVIREGPARPDTGEPGEIGGRAADRVLRAPADGTFVALRRIGDVVRAGEALFRVGDAVVTAPFDGCLRGLLHDGCRVTRGMKTGDVDPRGDPLLARAVSDKARAVGAAVVTAVREIAGERGIVGLLPVGIR